LLYARGGFYQECKNFERGLDKLAIKIYSIDSKREEKGKQEKNQEIFKKVLTKDKEKHIIKTR